MKKITLPMIFLVSILMLACKTPNEVQTRDVVRIETRTERVVEIDTQYVAIPQIKEVNVTKADSSFLENKYAISEAKVDTLGLLHHSLLIKPQELPVPVKSVTERKDSIVYQDVEVKVKETVEVERKLSWLEQTQIYGFRILVALITAGLLVWKRKELLTILRRFI